MKRVKFCGGVLDGGYCWVTEDENGMLLLTTPNTVYCGRRYDRGDYKDIVYHKQERKGEIKYVWIDEFEGLNK